MVNQRISTYAYSANIFSACIYRVRIFCKYMQSCPQHVFTECAYVGNQIWSVQSGHDFYAPNFGEVEGAYWFGPVCPSVCPSVRETQEPLMLEYWNYICGMYMKTKRTRIFFHPPACRSGVMPLFRLCMNNLVNRISEEPLWLGSWYLAYSYRLRCRWTE